MASQRYAVSIVILGSSAHLSYTEEPRRVPLANNVRNAPGLVCPGCARSAPVPYPRLGRCGGGAGPCQQWAVLAARGIRHQRKIWIEVRKCDGAASCCECEASRAFLMASVGSVISHDKRESLESA